MVPKTKPAPKRLDRSSAGSIAYSVRFDSEHFKRAQQLAKRKGVTVAAVIQMALAEKLERADRDSE